jgi:mannose-1-phosphate guanylyltransferase
MYCVIMAGGSGTRFWPRSREDRSKQFLTILGKKSLIQSTVMRFQSIVPWEDIYIVAKKSQKTELEKHILEVPRENILFEPIGKNTAPCIGLAALTIQERDSNGIMIVSPADHLIQKEVGFRRAILTAAKLAGEREGLVTIGITPEHPSTGYGYIQIDERVRIAGRVKAYSIKTFAEKPNLATAQRFLKSGDFFWNSGIFIFRVSVFLKVLEEFLPELHDGLMEIRRFINKPKYEEVLQKVYQQIRSISIDYGVMEKAKNVYLVKGDFTWNDLGSWEQVFKLSPKDKNGNTISGNAVLIDTKNSYVNISKGVFAVIGLEDVVVVQNGGATLVCKRDMVEEVKEVVDRLKRKKLHKYV